MTQLRKKKLIEVAIPLDDINVAAAYEKMPGIGPHPRGLHHYWARRPLVVCRAVLFAQLVDDPESRLDELLADDRLVKRAQDELPERKKFWEHNKASEGQDLEGDQLSDFERAVIEIERERLFDIIRDLVKWENSTNEEVLRKARKEIEDCYNGTPPSIYDPFSGGGSIPVEAQRLGLPSYGSDLNSVAVVIGKAMIEIPHGFKDMKPAHEGIADQSFYRNADGLSEDINYYGELLRSRARDRIGHVYPEVEMPRSEGGGAGKCHCMDMG